MADIYLVNPISGRGHLDAYARLYGRAFLELGHDVTLLARDDGGTCEYLAREGVPRRGHFRFVSFDAADDICARSMMAEDRSAMPIHRRTRQVWRQEGVAGVGRRLIVVPLRAGLHCLPAAAQTKMKRWAAGIVRWLNYDLDKVDFAPHVARLDAVARKERGTQAFAFFLYLDLMSQGRRSLRALDRDMRMPWAGILFHPALPDGDAEAYFSTRQGRGAVFLVPSAVGRYAEALPNLAFHAVPDVADGSLPDTEPAIVRDVRDRAAGRKIVLLAGSITPHKGVMTFVDLIERADPTRFFFVLAGEVHWESFAADALRLEAIWRNPPEHLYVHEGYIADERDYNALLATCDVLYAVYRNFQSSSNSLTKASIFRKPILVSAGTLMGARVVESGIGDAVVENDVDGILDAMQRLVERPANAFGYDTFCATHSLDALEQVLAAAVTDWCGSPRTGHQRSRRELAQ